MSTNALQYLANVPGNENSNMEIYTHSDENDSLAKHTIVMILA